MVLVLCTSVQQNDSTGVEDIDHGFVNNADSSSSDNEGECELDDYSEDSEVITDEFETEIYYH